MRTTMSLESTEKPIDIQAPQQEKIRIDEVAVQDYKSNEDDFAKLFINNTSNPIGLCSIKGKRSYQEDQLAASYDEVTHFDQLPRDAQKLALQLTFKEIHKQYGIADQGSTACV